MKSNLAIEPASNCDSGSLNDYLNYEKASKDAFLPFSEAERYRLVEAAKSPTQEILLNEVLKHAFKTRMRMDRPLSLAAQADGPVSHLIGREENIAATERFREQYTNEVGCKTIIQFREWSDEWRIMTRVDGTVGSPPPLQSGDRISKMLSDRAARKIADSCSYMASQGKGFQTFVTGTFSQESRDRIKSGETTIQKEVTRTMDALTKMYKRGWEHSNGLEKLPGHEYALAYCWVVEIPENSNGEINPHVHMMLGWSVDYKHFQPWRKRIEGIWGNGYFHLEKINDPLCAGAYMAKAAGYITKANGQSDQGEVKGNRYAISKAARAPEWYTIGEFELGIMGSLIREVHDSITDKHAAIFYERKRLHAERDKIRIDAKKIQKQNNGHYPLWAKKKLELLGNKIVGVREKINSLRVRTTKYQLILKGQEAFNRFLGWALAGGWSANARPDSHWLKMMKEKIYRRKHRRGAWQDHEITDQLEEKEQFKDESLSTYGDYLDYLDN